MLGRQPGRKKSSKKTLPEKIQELREQHADKNIRVMCMDECRVGLFPILRRVWAPVGCRPEVQVYPKYEWLYVFSAVEPDTGWTFPMIWSTVNLEAMQVWLNELAKQLEPNDYLLLIMDGAGWHSLNSLVLPPSIEILIQPPYSPECNPSERLWDLMKDRIQNRRFEKLADLEEELIVELKSWEFRTNELASLTGFSWWIDAVNSGRA